MRSWRLFFVFPVICCLFSCVKKPHYSENEGVIFTLPTARNASKVFPYSMGMVVGKKSIWLGRKKVLDLDSQGRIPHTYKRDKKALSFYVPSLVSTFEKRVKALKKKPTKKKKMVPHVSFALDKQTRFRTICEILYSTGQASISKFSFPVCLKRKGKACESYGSFRACTPEISTLPSSKIDMKKLEKKIEKQLGFGSLKSGLLKLGEFARTKEKDSSGLGKFPSSVKSEKKEKKKEVVKKVVVKSKQLTKQKLSLLVGIELEGYRLIPNGNLVLPASCHTSDKRRRGNLYKIPKKSGAYNDIALKKCFVDIGKTVLERKAYFILQAEKNTDYERVVRVVDMSQERIKGKRIFSCVVFSAGVI